MALYTKGGILLNPGKLGQIHDYMHYPIMLNYMKIFYSLLNWSSIKDYISCTFNNAKINSKNIIFATNGFLKSLGIKVNYNFPITLTASMTRKLTDEEFNNIGQPKEWGVLPVKPMGATIRMTKERKILIRNTAEIHNPFKMSKQTLEERSKIQKIGIKKRFPQFTR